MASPNPIDMTTMAAVLEWIPGQTNDQDVLQRLITGVSRDVVRYTGANIDNVIGSPTYGMSSLNAQINFTQRLDGNGSNVLFLRNRPIHVINSLLINGYAPPINVSYGQQGVFVESTGYSIAFGGGFGAGGAITTVGWPAYGSSGTFPMGRGNIQIGYLAGFGVPVPNISLTLASVALAVGDDAVYSGTITGGDDNAFVGQSFTVTGFLGANNNGTFQCLASDGATLTLLNPLATVEAHAASAVTNDLLFTTPEDLEVAVLQIIQLNYVNRDRSGLQTETISGTTTTSYTKYAWPPQAKEVIDRYVRVPLGSQA